MFCGILFIYITHILTNVFACVYVFTMWYTRLHIRYFSAKVLVMCPLPQMKVLPPQRPPKKTKTVEPPLLLAAAHSTTCAMRMTSCWSAIRLQKVKVKVHTLDIAPFRNESPPQKRSGMARVLKGFHSFTCTLTHSSAIGMSHTCLPFQPQLVLIYRPRRDGRLSRLWCEVAQAEIRTRNLLIANPALHHTATGAPWEQQPCNIW